MNPKLGAPPAHVTVEPSDLRMHGGTLWRIHRDSPDRPGWNQLRHHGPVPGMRFDPHEPPRGDDKNEGVQYLATRVADAFAEAFQTTRVIPLRDPRIRLVGWEPTRELTLLDLNGAWGVRNGASATLPTGPKRYTQPWARAIHQQLPEIDGLWHHGAMAGGDLVTLFTPAERGPAERGPAERGPVERGPVWPAAPTFSRSLADPLSRAVVLAVGRKLGYSIG